MFNVQKNLALVGLLSLGLVACDKESILPNSELPDEIKTYVSTHFPDNSILQVIKDQDGFIKSYDLTLSGNIGLEFNRKKEIIGIDGVGRLPDSVIPEKIRQYVSSNYPNQFITDWELDDRNQVVELDNGLDLKFNMAGDFLRLDD